MRVRLIVAFLLSAAFYACNSDATAPQGPSAADEANLIQAIESSPDKQRIDHEQLPPISQYILEENYADSYVDEVKMAPQLGYEVTTRKEWGTHIGDRWLLYFDMEGRELHHRGDGRENPVFDRNGDRRGECFTLVYPVSFMMPDGSVISGDDGKAVCTAIKEWYESNPDANERPVLQYPVQVIRPDGSIETINNAQEMQALKDSCKDKDEDHDGDRDGHHQPCFRPVYPVTFIMPDNSEITVSDGADWASIKNWYQANPDVTERPEPKFPIQVELSDGTTMTVNSADELRGLREDCDDWDDDDGKGHDKEFGPCFKLVYPLTFIMPDNSTITADSREEALLAILEWYMSNLGTMDRPYLQYPVDILYKDGTTVTINNVDELVDAFAACWSRYGHQHEDWDDDHHDHEDDDHD